jgi:hypothetical protein
MYPGRGRGSSTQFKLIWGREQGKIVSSPDESPKSTEPPTQTAATAPLTRASPPAVYLPTKRRGEVAEAAFLHKAASLGFSVSKPWGESDRYDFILDSGDHCWRVQVKSAHSSAINGYSFHACGNVHSRRYTAKDIDFIVGYVVPDDVWYVIPIEVFKDITTVKVFPSSRRRMSRYEKYRDAWDYFREPKPSTQNDETK